MFKVAASGFGDDDKADVAMLRLMLVTVVASPSINDTLLSECQVLLPIYDDGCCLVGWGFSAFPQACLGLA